ncbi:MAG: response regulator transcription factor [Bacteroidia bacterium]|nr:response regulator transcription factor [Bacteroidia bacterium]
MSTCLVIEDSRLARQELIAMLADLGSFSEILEAEDAEQGKRLLLQENPDLVFLDIHLPGQNGFEFLESLDELPKVIFTTAYDEYAIKSFDYNAIDYLLKPIKKDRLEKALAKLDLAPHGQPKTLGIGKQVFVKDGEKCWFIKLGDIRMFESVGNYSKVYFEGGKPMIHKSLNYLEGVLDAEIFFRVNRQQIINLNHIEKLDSWFNGKLKIRLKSGEEVEVSRRQSNRIKSLFSI